MERLRWQTLVTVFVLVAALSAMVLRWWTSRGNNPVPIPPLQVVLVTVLAVVVVLLGVRIRRIVGRGEPLEPTDAVRTLVLGQAAAITGAAHLGYFTAQLVLTLPRVQAPDPRTQAWLAGSAILAAVLMTGAGLIAQWCCRVPPSDDDPDGRSGPGPADPHLS